MASSHPESQQDLAARMREIAGRPDLFKKITGPKDLDGIGINTDIFAKRHPTDQTFDVLTYHGYNKYLNQTDGKSYNLSELLKEFGAGGIGVVNKEAVDKIKESTLRKRADTNQKRLTLDIETAMAGDTSTMLDKTYSLGIARHFENTRFDNLTKKNVAVFRHQKNGRNVMATAGQIYTDTLTKMAKNRFAFGEVNDLTKLNAYIENSHKQGILTQSDTKYLHDEVIKGSYNEQVQHEVSRYIKIKEHFLKGEMAGHVRFSSKSSMYTSLGMTDESKFSHEFFDETEFRNFTQSYLDGDLKVQDRMFGKEGLKHTLRHSSLSFLKHHIGKGNVTKNDAMQIAMDFYQGIYNKEYGNSFKGSPDAENVFNEHKKKMQEMQQHEGHNLIIDLRGRRNKDLQHLHQMLFQNVHEVMGNHGSTTESEWRSGAETVIERNNAGVRPRHLDTALRNPIKDSMGPMIDGLANLSAAHTHTGLVDSDGIKRSFYQLYGNNQKFSRMTGIDPSEVKSIIGEATDLIYDKYGGNKTVQNLMNVMKILAKEPHRAGPDAAMDARAASMMANDLSELQHLRSQTKLTQYGEYRMRELGLKYANGVFTQLILNRSNKNSYILDDNLKEHANRKMIRDLEESTRKRNGLSAEREARLRQVAHRQIENEMRSARHSNSSNRFMFEGEGMSNWKQFFGGAALMSGIGNVAARLTQNAKDAAFVSTNDDGTQKINAFSHNGIQRVIDRLNNSDFGSGRKSGNPSTLRSMWDIFGKSLDETATGRRVNTMMSNINTRFRKAGSMRQKIERTSRGLIKDFGRVVMVSNPDAGKKIMDFSKKTTVFEMLEKNFVKPITDLKTGKTQFTKLVPSIMKTRVGKVMLAAGAITGIGLYAVTGKTMTDREAEIKKKAEDYTKKNKIKGTNPWPNSNADKLAEIMNSKQAGMQHGGLQRQVNRTNLTDFRSAMSGVTTFTKGVVTAIQDAGAMKRTEHAIEQAIRMPGTVVDELPHVGAIQKEAAIIEKTVDAEASTRIKLKPIEQTGTRVETDTSTTAKLHKHGDTQGVSISHVFREGEAAHGVRAFKVDKSRFIGSGHTDEQISSQLMKFLDEAERANEKVWMDLDGTLIDRVDGVFHLTPLGKVVKNQGMDVNVLTLGFNIPEAEKLGIKIAKGSMGPGDAIEAGLVVDQSSGTGVSKKVKYLIDNEVMTHTESENILSTSFTPPPSAPATISGRDIARAEFEAGKARRAAEKAAREAKGNVVSINSVSPNNGTGSMGSGSGFGNA